MVLFTALDAGALAEGLLPCCRGSPPGTRWSWPRVHDPETARLAELPAPGATATDVYRRRPRTGRWSSGSRVRSALVRYGVDVIDAPVRQFASKVADAYLAPENESAASNR